MFSMKTSFSAVSAAKPCLLRTPIPRCGWLRPMAVVCLLLLAAVSARGQASQGNLGQASIHGTLTTTQDGAATALADITVTLNAAAAGFAPVRADTDESGRYEFKDVKPGAYTVAVGLDRK